MLCTDIMLYVELLLWWKYFGYDLDQVISERIIDVVIIVRRWLKSGDGESKG